MKTLFSYVFTLLSLGVLAQEPARGIQHSDTGPRAVVITGARFSYPLVQRWIDEFNKTNPDIQVIIEARGSNDPSQYDILAEVYEPDATQLAQREYLFAGRYAILPVANAGAALPGELDRKGLSQKLIRQIYFHDPFADAGSVEKIRSRFTVYTRLQKAGTPVVFAQHFGFEQKDLQGKRIAGSDEHLLKAILRDSSAISFLPSPTIYNPASGDPVQGLTGILVDIDGNGKLSEEERIINQRDALLAYLGKTGPDKRRNIPVAYLHLSVLKDGSSPEARLFLDWVRENGHSYLRDYGFLEPEDRPGARLDK